ncbi:MAG: ATP-binding cassette domain-containing protein, partial [Clostridia bacterium]
MMPLFFKKMKFIVKKEMVTNVLQKIGIYDLVNKQTSVLSGGEKQRVAIARALINNPDIILADEPTGNLDKENSILIFELLQKISKEGKTVVMVSHDEKGKEYCSKLINLDYGKIVL